MRLRTLLAAALLWLLPLAAGAQGIQQGTGLQEGTGLQFGTGLENGSGLEGTAGLSPKLALRAPTPADNATLGFTANQYWLNTATGTLYQATSVTGRAVWTPVSVSASLPLDIAPVGAGGIAYATCKLRAAYAGAAVNVTRASDSTSQDIGFAANGCMDAAAINTFCAGTTCSFGTFYDQSGNALNATQATVANQPQWENNTLGYTGGQPSLSFGSLTFPNSTPRYLSFGASVAFTSNNFSMATVWGPFIAAGNEQFGLFAGTTQGNNTITQKNPVMSGGLAGVAVNYNNWTSAKPQTWMVTRGTNGVGSNTGGLWENGYFLTQSFAPSVNSFAGGSIASSVGTQGDLGAFIVWPASLTAANAQAVHLKLMTMFSLPPQTHGQIVADGDSITYGFVSTTTQEYPYQMQPTLKYPMELRDLGTPGDTCAQLATAYPTSAAGFYNAAALNNILIIWCGTNDMATGAQVTPAQAYANLTSYINLAHGTGYKVVAVDMLPRGTVEANRIIFNGLVLANAAGAEAIADVAANPIMGCPSCNTNLTYYATDGVHPIKAGQAILAPIIAAAVNRIIK